MNRTPNMLMLLVTITMLAGCRTTVPVIEPSIECPIKDEELTSKCAVPAAIPAGTTYQDLINISVEDRKSLAKCEEQRRFLQQSINDCNAAIREHNAKIDALNEKNSDRH